MPLIEHANNPAAATVHQNDPVDGSGENRLEAKTDYTEHGLTSAGRGADGPRATRPDPSAEKPHWMNRPMAHYALDSLSRIPESAATVGAMAGGLTLTRNAIAKAHGGKPLGTTARILRDAILKIPPSISSSSALRAGLGPAALLGGAAIGAGVNALVGAPVPPLDAANDHRGQVLAEGTGALAGTGAAALATRVPSMFDINSEESLRRLQEAPMLERIGKSSKRITAMGRKSMPLIAGLGLLGAGGALGKMVGRKAYDMVRGGPAVASGVHGDVDPSAPPDGDMGDTEAKTASLFRYTALATLSGLRPPKKVAYEEGGTPGHMIESGLGHAAKLTGYGLGGGVLGGAYMASKLAPEAWQKIVKGTKWGAGIGGSLYLAKELLKNVGQPQADPQSYYTAQANTQPYLMQG